MVALMLVAAALCYIGGHFAWEGDECLDTRERHTFAVMFCGGGLWLLWGVLKAWKERNELEESWKRIISNPDSLQDIHKHPEHYRDDFKRWVEENHPHNVT
jgi:hypothetical protein